MSLISFLKSLLFIGLIGLPEVAFSLDNTMRNTIAASLKIAANQCLFMANALIGTPGALPKSTAPDGTLTTSESSWWTSGFFPGTLWYLYEATNDSLLKNMAEEYTRRIECEQYTTSNHDVGFMIYCSVGNAQRILPSLYRETVLITAATSLSTRFRPFNGCIQSWNIEDWNRDRGWQCPVIIDNMMNLELLMWAYKQTQNKKFRDISVSHADVTLKNHFRSDYSSYHVVSYDTLTGQAAHRGTHQGYAHESAWSRGQAWALYGYTMMYRETRKKSYLKQAISVAGFILNHPDFPEDAIPYWDFNAPNIPRAKKDASAAAIMASALIELSTYVKEKELARKYLSVASRQLTTLSSSDYLAAEGTNAGFILKHSVGNLPDKSEVDAPLTYADYYYVEALLRYQKFVLDKTSDYDKK